MMKLAEDHREAEQGGDHGPDVGAGAVLDEPALLPDARGRRGGEAGRRGATPAARRGRERAGQEPVDDVQRQRPPLQWRGMNEDSRRRLNYINSHVLM